MGDRAFSRYVPLSICAQETHTSAFKFWLQTFSLFFGLLEVFLFSRKSSSSVVTVERAVF